jgi:serine/threonine protein kinase/Tol biopolymer transport system component
MVGQQVGHYRVLRKIGEGGMGHVYLAEDVTLDRKVALKVLAHTTPNSIQIARFEREAKAAAALEHPNIVAIHEFGHEGAMPFVVMELLDGSNLRQRLHEGPLVVHTAVTYALEILAGLAAAHAKGICHRDLKPENIFITAEGRVKILDFGLANMRADEAAARAADASVTRERLTTPGLVLGTVGYMAPEQVRGEAVDPRADIFAFGAVFFEMLTARRAFNEVSTVETLHGILKADAPLHMAEQAGVPHTVVQFLGRCLAKLRDHRYQSAQEAASVLRSLQLHIGGMGSATTPLPAHRLDSWKEIAAFLRRGVRTVQRWEREEQMPVHRLPHAKRGSVYADQDELARWWESRRHTLDSSPAASTPAPPPGPGPSPSGTASRIERVTDTAFLTVSPALSSDARMVAYISTGTVDAAAPQVWLQEVGGAAMRLTSGLRECADPAFTADDTRVLFTAKGETTLNVYAVPVFGGEARRLKAHAKCARMSPDGKWLAYLSLEGEGSLRLDRTDGTAGRILAPGLTSFRCVVWSPDSDHVLVRAQPDATFLPDFWAVPVDGRPPVNTCIMQRFRAQGALLDSPPAWIQDSIVTQVAGRDGVLLWRQRLTPGSLQMAGDPDALTRGIEWAGFPTAAGRRLAYLSSRSDVNLWVVRIDPATGTAQAAPRRITRGPGVIGHLNLASDGKTLAYFAARPRLMPNVFLRDLDSGIETMVPADPPHLPKACPAISPSGGQLAYGTVVPGSKAMRPLFIVDLPSGPSRQLCDDCGGRPRLWLDEESILVETFGSRLSSFVVIDVKTGRQRPLMSSPDLTVANPRVSHDDRWIAFDAARPGGAPAVFVAPVRGGSAIPESDWRLVADDATHPFWSADDCVLYFLPTTPTRELRTVVSARHFDPTSGGPQGDAFEAVLLTEAVIATQVPGTTPVVTQDQMLLVLADISGDIWMMDL